MFIVSSRAALAAGALVVALCACFSPQYPTGLPCEGTGVGDCPPEQTCVAAVCVACTADEVCDGAIDDDCDGLADAEDGCACVDGAVQACGLAFCGGSQRCVNGAWAACEGERQPRAAEVCGDDVDDDCNGAADDGCPCEPGAVKSCGVTEVGPCTLGTEACTAGGQWSGVCNAVLPGIEECNGLDEDCSGTPDDTEVCQECLQIPDILVHDLTLRGGDPEFAGHGPEVKIDTRYAISGGRVCATVEVTMTETAGGETATVGRKLVEDQCSEIAPGNIAAIRSANTLHSYVDDDPSTGGVWDYVTPMPNSGIATIRCVGDTGGADICIGGNNFTDCSKCELLGVCVAVRYQE